MSSLEQPQFRTSQAAVRRRLRFRLRHGLTFKVIIDTIFISAFLAVGTIAGVLYSKTRASLPSQRASNRAPVFAFLALVPDDQSLPEGGHNVYRSRQKQYRFYPRHHRKVKFSSGPSTLLQRYWPRNVTSTDSETNTSSGNHRNIVSGRIHIVVGRSTSNAINPLKIAYNSDGFAAGQSNNASTVPPTVAFTEPMLAQVSDFFSNINETSTSRTVVFMNVTLGTSTVETNYTGSANSHQASTFDAGPFILHEISNTTQKPTALSSTADPKTQRSPASVPDVHVSSWQLPTDAATAASTMHQASKSEFSTKHVGSPVF